MRSWCAALLLLSIASAAPGQPAPDTNILIFSHTSGFRHDSIPAGIRAISDIARGRGIQVVASEDPSVFDDATLIMDALGVKLGFGFSAGLFDFVLGYGLATRPLLLIPVGVAYSVINYVTFSWCIRRFNLATPGREPDAETALAAAVVAGERGEQFVVALGGAANLKSVDACTTRLRLALADPTAIDEPALRALGARGIVRPGGDSVQVVIGPIADQVAGEIRAASIAGRASVRSDLPIAIAGALGRFGIRTIGRCGSRLLVGLDNPSGISAVELDQLGSRGWVAVPGGVQIIIGPEAEEVVRELRSKVA